MLLPSRITKLTDQPLLTGSQQIFGTPGYIAPEYIQSANIDGRSDLYSLGVILYEMVTGALPFDYEYPGDLLIKHVTEPPIRPSVRRPGLPAPIEELVLRCLEKNPDRRFRDAFHFLEELRACRERLGSDLAWGSIARPEAGPPGSGGKRTESIAPTPAESLGVVPASAASPRRLPSVPVAVPVSTGPLPSPTPARATPKDDLELEIPVDVAPAERATSSSGATGRPDASSTSM